MSLSKITRLIKNTLDYIYLKIVLIFLKRKARYPGHLHFFNTHIDYPDPLSLYLEIKDIYLKQVYHFSTTKTDPLIIDGGSFIGVSILYFKRYYPKASIIAFEPNRKSLKYLKKNLKSNRLTDVSVIEKGLGYTTKSVNFIPSSADAGKVDPAGTEIITVDRLSRYINSEIDYLKLNIEGSELEVLKDLDKTGKINQIKMLCLEWHSFDSRRQNLAEILSILQKNHFRYIVNHFDYETNPRVEPPFSLEKPLYYYLLVYASK